jgi:hypothetical protein
MAHETVHSVNASTCGTPLDLRADRTLSPFKLDRGADVSRRCARTPGLVVEKINLPTGTVVDPHGTRRASVSG